MLPLLAYEVRPYLVCGEAVWEVGQVQTAFELNTSQPPNPGAALVYRPLTKMGCDVF